jgi:hypothetical protein
MRGVPVRQAIRAFFRLFRRAPNGHGLALEMAHGLPLAFAQAIPSPAVSVVSGLARYGAVDFVFVFEVSATARPQWPEHLFPVYSGGIDAAKAAIHKKADLTFLGVPSVTRTPDPLIKSEVALIEPAMRRG